MRLDDLKPGLELGPSSWLDMSQSRINAFADATEDHQSFHVDAEAAARGPYGTTIAHGYLTLSLMAAVVFELVSVDATVINYGVDRVRFPAPVPAGSRIRASLRVDSVEPVNGGVHVAMTATAERDGGGDRPVCVAQMLFRYLA